MKKLIAIGIVALTMLVSSDVSAGRVQTPTTSHSGKAKTCETRFRAAVDMPKGYVFVTVGCRVEKGR